MANLKKKILLKMSKKIRRLEQMIIRKWLKDHLNGISQRMS